jgi:uncharacterized SAM-binding protein YcdF (DUF218 family)
MKLISFILIFFGCLIYSFFNLGKFLDVTQEPSKTDLIVSLGGNGYLRLQKSLSLVEQNFSSTIIITGYDGTKATKAKNIPDPRLKVMEEEKYKNINFIINPDLKNTAEEIVFVKKYMKENNLKDVTFVTEKPHSRRILILANILGEKSDFKYKIVSYNIKYWQSEEYYKNKYAREYAFIELVKIIYNVLYYGVFYNLGIDIFFEKSIEELRPLILNKIKEFAFLSIF